MRDWTEAVLTTLACHTEPITKNQMKKSILIIVLAAAVISCGESKNERAQRQSEENDRQLVRELHRNENIQRQADRDQRTLETGAKVLDVLTR